MGSTEVGGYGIKASAPEEWMYYNLDPETGFCFLRYQDDLHESIIVRHTDLEKASTQIIFRVFPELDIQRMCGGNILPKRGYGFCVGGQPIL